MGTRRMIRTGRLAMLAMLLVSMHAAAQQQDTERRDRLVVNLPAARLDVFHDGVLLKSYPVTIGSRSYPTPIGEFQLSSITWNPWWLPPPSEWARNENAQPPGERNPMGRVKIRFSDYYYLHGTADTRNIGRAASHGCIRLRNPDAQELARLVTGFAGTVIPALALDSLETNQTLTRQVALDCSVPLSVRYDLAAVRDSVLEIYPDIYRRGPDLRSEVMRALADAGLTSEQLDLERLEQMLKRRPLPDSIPLRTITRPEVWRRLYERR